MFLQCFFLVANGLRGVIGKIKNKIIPFERKKNSEDGKGHFVPHPKGAKTIREVNYEGNY